MSKKYVIDLPDDAQYILINGASENHCYTRVEQVDDLEELNSDYINEHYGELQDEAYRKGYDDGKDSFSKGCEGCRYTSKKSHEEPCFSCTRNHMDQYEPMPKEDDRIEVGDEVTVASLTDGPLTVVGKAKVLDADGDQAMCYSLLSAKTGTVFEHDVKDHGMDEWETPFKTGRHFDHIDKLLEAMRT